MKNERGNVIVLVLLILSVVSLIGAGTLLMSRYDMKFTTAFKSYDRGFNLADGANSAAYRYIKRADANVKPVEEFKGRNAANAPNPNQLGDANRLGCECLDLTQCKDPNKRKACKKCFESQDPSAPKFGGKFDYYWLMLDIDTSGKPNWAIGEYYEQQWDAQGQAVPFTNSPFQSVVESSVSKMASTGK